MNRTEKQHSKQLKPSFLNTFNLSNSKEEANIALDAYGEFLMKNRNIHSISVSEEDQNYILKASVYSLYKEKKSDRNCQFGNLTFHGNVVSYQLPYNSSLQEMQIQSINDICVLKEKSEKRITVKLREAKFKKDAYKYNETPSNNIVTRSTQAYRVLEDHEGYRPYERPFLGGSNISYADSKDSYGTLGAIVRLEEYDDLFLMTAAHVICPNYLLDGTLNNPSRVTVVQPSNRTSRDVVARSIDRTIANIFWWRKVGNYDLAFARIKDESNAGSGVKQHGEITGLVEPKYGMRVKMFGATTRRNDIRATITVEKSTIRDHDDPSKIITNTFKTTDIGQDGDSGAILLSDDLSSRNKAVGLAIKDAEANSTTFMRLDILKKELKGNENMPNIKFHSFY